MILLATIEKWLYGFKNKYKIDTDGRVFRVAHRVKGKVGYNNTYEKKLTPYAHSQHGALYIRITSNKKTKLRRHLAKLVLKTFKKQVPKLGKEVVFWRNGNKNDNSVDNLTILTVKIAREFEKERRRIFDENLIITREEKVKGIIYTKDKRQYTIKLRKEK